jgi:hypothetical protein
MVLQIEKAQSVQLNTSACAKRANEQFSFSTNRLGYHIRLFRLYVL